MNKAFIFDMDGVIVNSEPIWARLEQNFLSKLLSMDKYLLIKNETLGNSVNAIYKICTKVGLKMAKKEFENIYDQNAKIVYKEAKITNEIEKLFSKLITMNYGLGLVSSSRQYWIDLVLKKLNRKNLFQFMLAEDSKPNPQGYLTAIKKLGATPPQTIILEDSPKGIQAAKKSGAQTICLTEFITKNNWPKGADIYVNSIKELIEKINQIKL